MKDCLSESILVRARREVGPLAEHSSVEAHRLAFAEKLCELAGDVEDRQPAGMRRGVAAAGITFSVVFYAVLAWWALTPKACHAADCWIRDTGSMRGWAPKGGGRGDLEPVPFAAVKVGQVVIYRHRRAALVAHRVIERKAGALWTKGDSNRMPDDQWITPADYLGVVEFSSANPVKR